MKNATVIRIENLTKRFKRRMVIDDLSLQMDKGSFMALLGPNGAGKTTTIKILLNLLLPDSGEVEVMGMNPIREGVRIRQKVGYVPERANLIQWMTVGQLLRFVADFYPDWDSGYAIELLQRFRLDPRDPVRHISRGQEAKLSLMLALSHKPELLILDDATSGIDAAARKDILEGLITHIHSEGTSILFSTHLIHEVEGLADRIAVIQAGRLILHKPAEELKAGMKRIRQLQGSSFVVPESAKIIDKKKTGDLMEWIVDGGEMPGMTEDLKSGKIEITDMSLEEIYIAFTRNSSGEIRP